MFSPVQILIAVINSLLMFSILLVPADTQGPTKTAKSQIEILIAVINSLLVFFILLVPADTQGTVASCVPEIKVRKNTVYTDFREEPFQLSCPVTYCEKTPDVQWIKIDDKSKFIQINETNIITITQEHKGSKDLISNLTFKRISTDDNGVYRCKIFTPTFKLESHNININITDFSDHITTNTPTPARTRSGDNWVLYFLICTGILGLVLTVMLISYLSINGCPTKTAKSQIEFTTVLYTQITSKPETSS